MKDQPVSQFEQPKSKLTNHSAMSMSKDEELPPSKIQQLASELFRTALCRNDDFNLAQSSLMKNAQQ
jgi:hypothetical protein